MRISVFGLGYVGAVSCGCLAELGHDVIGVDVNADKVGMIRDGRSPIVEERIGEMIAEQVAAGRLTATDNVAQAVKDTDVSFVSVGTPSGADGAVSLAAIDAVSRQIGEAIADKDGDHIVVIRSTVPPGTTMTRVAPILEEASGRKLGQGLGLAFNPEFLREGSSVKDFYNPPLTIIGSDEKATYEAVAAIYDGLPNGFHHVPAGEAEAAKYLANTFHALKIVFANEAGTLLKSLGVDAREALRLFCEDSQLNISKAYLRPGFAFGGSCLPKDVRAMLALARDQRVAMPMLEQLIPSNIRHIDRALELIAEGGRGTVALFGLAFKPGTDDMRESPLVALAERLIGRGFPLVIVDRNVQVGRLIGANRSFIEKEIPHLERLLANDAEAAAEYADIIVIGHIHPEDAEAIKPLLKGKRVIDLAGQPALAEATGDSYIGICW